MPRPAIHPGEILADELLELGVTPTELARQINVPANRITQIIQGKRGITGNTHSGLVIGFRQVHSFGSTFRPPMIFASRKPRSPSKSSYYQKDRSRL